MSAPLLPMWRVVLAAAGVAIPVGVGALCGVNLARPLLTAMSRAAVQLTLLGGLILAPLMRSTSPLLIFSYAMLMILVAGREASSKLPWRYSGVKVDSLIAAAGGAGVAAFAGITLVIQPSPWFSAQTVIPVCGMVLGNGLDAVGLGLRTYLASVNDRPGPIQLAIGLGASRFEAVHSEVSQAVMTAILPKMNSMTVAGLVSIPGMMTGQVLAGQDPLEASRYQIMILYLIAAGSLSSVGIALWLASARLLDSCGRLRLDLLTRPPTHATNPLKDIKIDPLVLKGGPRRATITCRTFDKTASPTPAVILTVPHLEVFAAGHPLFVLNGLTLSEGDICGVTGPSGSGKSSLLTAITMSLPPDRAVGTEDMTLRGRRFEELGGSAWRAGCLTVPQSVPPIPGVTCTEWFRSVLQYAVWSHLDTTAMVEAMEGIAAELLLTRQELNETEISSLSGGERHRAILACALALSPVVLLLDEPTAALDPTSAAAVEAQLVHFAANGTSAVVIVSHDVGLVDRLAHKTVVIGGG